MKNLYNSIQEKRMPFNDDPSFELILLSDCRRKFVENWDKLHILYQCLRTVIAASPLFKRSLRKDSHKFARELKNVGIYIRVVRGFGVGAKKCPIVLKRALCKNVANTPPFVLVASWHYTLLFLKEQKRYEIKIQNWDISKVILQKWMTVQ